MAVDDIIHRLFLAQPPQKGPHTPASMCGSGWPHPSCLSGWASFLVRPGFPPNESWAAGRLLSRSQVFALWLNKSCQRGAGLYLGLSPPLWPADSLSEQGWVLWPRPAMPDPACPRLLSPVLLPHWLPRAGLEHRLIPSYSAAPSPPRSPGLHGLRPTDWAALSGGRVAFPRDPLLPIKIFTVGDLPPTTPAFYT